jgi:rod shape-determining protein MreC
MDFFLNRYRNLSVLLVAIVAQLALLAYQIKSGQDVRLIRVWAVSAVTPLARWMETGRGGVGHFFRDYFLLLSVRRENQRLKADLDRSEMENQYLRGQLSTADRAGALAIFQKTSESRTLAARVIGNTTDPDGQTVIVDRGAADGVQKGMAVIKPEGIVGKVIGVFPHAADVLLVTDPTFAAGVVSQSNRAYGTLKGLGQSAVMVDYVQNEETVEPGEWFLTSGDDLIFPRGIPAGQVTVVRPGRTRKEVYLMPSGLQNGLEGVLIVLDGVHGTILGDGRTEAPLPNQPVHLLAPPPESAEASPAALPQTQAASTDLDRSVDRYRAIGAAQNHRYGDKNSPAPNFNAAPEPPSSPHP